MSRASNEKTVAGVITVHGIDVSGFQGTIDWQEVVTTATEQGQQVRFAYIKATEGSRIVDPQFAANWRNSQGRLPRGAYHFFHATGQSSDARRQADNFINTIQAALAATGEEEPELPPMVDVEWGSIPDGVTVQQAEASLKFFLSLVEQAFGARPIIYTGPAFWQEQMANSQVFSHQYLLWVATYGAPRSTDGGFDAPTRDPLIPGGWTTFGIWQNAVQPGVAGIQGLVDRNQILLPVGTTVVDFLNQRLGTPPVQDDDLQTALLQRAGAAVRIQFTRDSKLFKQIVTDGLAPNSLEFSIGFTGATYQVQRAERLDGNEVRVYYTQPTDGEQVQFVVRPIGTTTPSAGPAEALRDALIAAAEANQVLRFNKDAGLQRRIRADGYLPTSGEVALQFKGANYAAQCAEHPATGLLRVYYARDPNWANVQFFDRA